MGSLQRTVKVLSGSMCSSQDWNRQTVSEDTGAGKSSITGAMVTNASQCKILIFVCNAIHTTVEEGYRNGVLCKNKQ